MPGPTPSRGVYGLAMHLAFQITFIAFIIWAAVPEKWFHDLGITYLPQHYWAVAVPIFVLTVIALFAFIIYPSLGLLMTPDIDSLDTIQDSHSKLSNDRKNHINVDKKRRIPCVCRKQTFCMKHIYDTMDDAVMQRNAIPGVRDLHIEDVSEDLYL